MFVIMAQPRTGSHYLAQNLNFHAPYERYPKIDRPCVVHDYQWRWPIVESHITRICWLFREDSFNHAASIHIARTFDSWTDHEKAKPTLVNTQQLVDEYLQATAVRAKLMGVFAILPCVITTYERLELFKMYEVARIGEFAGMRAHEYTKWRPSRLTTLIRNYDEARVEFRRAIKIE